jgi:hypothetical protein
VSAKLLYRISAVVLVLFAAGHTVGFSKVDPGWNAEAVVSLMRGVHFNIGAFQRNYWDFYLGFGYFVGVFQLFSALIAWQLSGLSRETLASLPVLTWGLALCYVAVTFLSWRFFFLPPIVFSGLLALLLILAARAGK